MNNVRNYIDPLFLIILGGMLALAFYYHFFQGFVIPVSTYLGVLAWIITGGIFFVKRKNTFLFIIGVLALFTFGIINFNIFIATAGSAGNENPIINPLALLLLLIYIILKRKTIRAMWALPPDQQKAKQESEVDFYYKKFNDSSPEDLENSMRYFKDYPPEAQIALKKIRSERQK